MGRRIRIHFDGAVYHVMARGVDGRDIFVDDRDRSIFVGNLMKIADDMGAHILAYCLMGNHFHLALKIGSVPLAAIMQRLLTSYALVFNRRYERTGHLFQARYKAIVCIDERYLATLIRYIHLNPVRAGLVANPADWPWSSFKGHPVDASGEMGEFDPWRDAEAATAKLLRAPKSLSCTINEIGSMISAQSGVSIQELRSDCRRRWVTAAKRRLTQQAVASGHSLIAVAKWLGSTPSSTTRYVQKNTANTGKPDA